MPSGFNKNTNTKSKNYNYDVEKIEVVRHRHPIFCFKYQHNKYNLQNCDNNQKSAFIDQICLLSGMTWEEIQCAPKHGAGSEKIKISKKMRQKCPDFITNDVDFLLALRFNGKMPFLVHRDKFIAHVIFVDTEFEVYGH